MGKLVSARPCPISGSESTKLLKVVPKSSDRFLLLSVNLVLSPRTLTSSVLCMARITGCTVPFV